MWWRREDLPIWDQRNWPPSPWLPVAEQRYGLRYFAPNNRTVIEYLWVEYQVLEIEDKRGRPIIHYANNGTATWTFQVFGRDESGIFELCRNTITFTLKLKKRKPTWHIFPGL